MADEEQRENARMLLEPMPYQILQEHEFQDHDGYDARAAMEAAGRARRHNPNVPNDGEIPPDSAHPWRVRSRGDNFGLCSTRELPADEPVLACRGVVHFAHDPPPRLDYALSIPAGFIIYYFLKASLFWFVNSSCRPNTKMVYFWVNDICYPCLVPLRRIAAFEDITWDFNYSRDPTTPLRRCLCGAGNLCRLVLAYMREDEERYKCPICQRCFDNAGLRYQHIVVVEIFGGRIPCPITGCICSYIHMTNLYRHIHKKHPSNAPRDFLGSFHRTCLQCGETFNGPSAFMAHVEECIGLEVAPLPPAQEEDEQQIQQEQQPVGLIESAMIQSGILNDLGNYVLFEEDVALNTDAHSVINSGISRAEYENCAPQSSTLPQPGTSTGGYTNCGKSSTLPQQGTSTGGYNYAPQSSTLPQPGTSTGGYTNCGPQQPCTSRAPYPFYATVQSPLLGNSTGGYPYFAPPPSHQQVPSSGCSPHVQDLQQAPSPRPPYHVDASKTSKGSSREKHTLVQDLFSKNINGIVEQFLQQQKQKNQPRPACGDEVTKERVFNILQERIPCLLNQIFQDSSTSPEEIEHRRAIQQRVEAPCPKGYTEQFLKYKAQSQASKPKPLSKAPPKSPTFAIKRQIASLVKTYFDCENPTQEHAQAASLSVIPNREEILRNLNTGINEIMQMTLAAVIKEQCMHCIRVLNKSEMESRVAVLEEQVGNLTGNKRRRSSSSNEEEEGGNKRDSSKKPLKKKPTKEDDQS